MSHIPNYIQEKAERMIQDNPYVDVENLAVTLRKATNYDDRDDIIDSLYEDYLRQTVALYKAGNVHREKSPILTVNNGPERQRIREREEKAMMDARLARGLSIQHRVAAFIPIVNEIVTVPGSGPMKWGDMTLSDVVNRRQMVSRQIRGLGETDDLLREAELLLRDTGAATLKDTIYQESR